MSYIYLINDILFNSKNTKIKYSWIFKEFFKELFPDFLFNLFSSKKIQKDKNFFIIYKTIIDNIKQWKIFPDKFLNGLYYYIHKYSSDLLINDSIKKMFNEKIKKEIEKYENELFDLYINDTNKLKETIKQNGFYNDINYGDIIEKLKEMKEYELYKECINEIDGEECEEDLLDFKITKLKGILKKMKNSYNKINNLDNDGIKIDLDEYEYFSLELPKNEIEEDNNINNNEKKNENNNINDKNIKLNEIEYDPDLDGEPL